MERCLSLISSHFSSIILISSVSCIPTDFLIRVAVVLDQHQDEAALLQHFPATSILLLPQGALQVFDQTVKLFLCFHRCDDFVPCIRVRITDN
jgi:hypothetical protein